jgi:membrane protein
MSRPTTNNSRYLALVAGIVLATLAVQRHLSRLATPTPEDDAPAKPAMMSRPRASSNGLKAILLRTYYRINEDRLLATAAGVVFYGLLAIFPATTALVSSYGLFADPSTIAANLEGLALMLPEQTFAIVRDQIARVLAKETSTLGLTFTFGLLMAIWSANAGMKAIFDALNVAYEEREKRSLVQLNLISLAFTVAALATILLMIGGVIAVPLALQRLGLGERGEWIVSIGRWPALLLLLMTALAVLYRFGPSRLHARWQWLSPGAIAASMLWLAGSFLLSWYLSNFGSFTATYGSLGAAIGLMTWMWMSAIIVMCGAELNSEIDRACGTERKAMHQCLDL